MPGAGSDDQRGTGDERSYRQYCVLDDPTLAKVYRQRKRYSEMLDAHAGVLPDDKLYRALRQDLNNLAQLQCNNSGPDAAAAARLEALPVPIPNGAGHAHSGVLSWAATSA